jgi:hypothetical protein
MNVYLVTEAKQSPFSSPVQNAPRLESLLHPFSDRGNCEIGDGRTGGRSWNNPHRYKTSSRRLEKTQNHRGGEYKPAHRGNYSQLRIELRQQQRPRLPIPT